MSLKFESIMFPSCEDHFNQRDFLRTRNRENSVLSPTFLISFCNIQTKDKIQVAPIAFIALPLAVKQNSSPLI
jgi:hypothetical protein